MKRLIFFLSVALVVVGSGCNEDLGNYDYRDINEVLVDINEEYAVKKTDTTVVIRPEFKQSIAGDLSNLSFEWYYNRSSDQFKGDLLSDADTVAIEIDTEDPKFSYDHFLRFYITDNLTGAKYLFPVHLKVIKPYEGAWMVLHQNEQGTATLAAVEFIGEEVLMTPDVLMAEAEKSLTGKPVRLGVATYFNAYQAPAYNPTCLFFCFTDNPEESGPYMPDRNFEQYDNPTRFIYEPHYELFDPTDVVVCDGQGRGRLMISGGNIFQGGMYDTKMYAANPAMTFTGDYNITHGRCIGWTHVLFDSLGKRFVHFYNSNSASAGWSNFDEVNGNKATFEPIKKSEQNVPDIDPNKLPADQEMIYLGVGFWYGQSMMAAAARHAAYGVTVSQEKNKVYLYEFHGYALYSAENPNAPDPPFAFYNELENKMGLTVDTPMASTDAFNRLLYYGKNNTLYRLDMGSEAGSYSAVYQHPNPDARIVAIKAARDTYDANYSTVYANYGHDVTRSFAVAYQMPDGTGELVIVNLNTAGKRESVIEGISGFGKITDIEFI